ncbi:trypsin-like peptidase domain-containing protein, partial [Candidatus Kaiserbacteria bacterium]|nr:trypsin-like peptidase domain-containing protein [Candidatus Kaiserbacteria bacterium]
MKMWCIQKEESSMRTLIILTLAILFGNPNQTEAHYILAKNGCQNVDYETLGQSVVSISFLYDEPDEEGALGHVGTAWFITPTLLVTVGHITRDVLSSTWSEVEIGWGGRLRESLDESFPFQARLYNIFPTGLRSLDTGKPENVAIIEIQAPINGTKPARVRLDTLMKNEPVVAVGYRGTEKALQWATGHFSPPEQAQEESDTDEEPLQPFLYFEMTNELGEDRRVLDRGTSGSPVFDCSGKVVGIISGIIENEIGSFPHFSNDANGLIVVEQKPL